MESAPLDLKKLVKRRSKPKNDRINRVETVGDYPVPTSSFKLDIVDMELGQYTVDCTPAEFNPLAIAMDMWLGQIYMSYETRAKLLADHGYLFPTVVGGNPEIH